MAKSVRRGKLACLWQLQPSCLLMFDQILAALHTEGTHLTEQFHKILEERFCELTAVWCQLVETRGGVADLWYL